MTTLSKPQEIAQPTPVNALNNLAHKMDLNGWSIISRIDKFKDMATNVGWFSASKNGVFLHVTTASYGLYSISMDYIPSREHGSGCSILNELAEDGLNMANIERAEQYYNRYNGKAKKYKSLDEYLSTRGKFYSIDVFDFAPLTFLKGWVEYDKDEKKVLKDALKHLRKHEYKHIATHGGKLEPFKPNTASDIDKLLGLAYTSTGAYAGLWVCNGGYLMYNDTHHFTGFVVNSLGNTVAIVEDEEENAIYIQL